MENEGQAQESHLFGISLLKRQGGKFLNREIPKEGRDQDGGLPLPLTEKRKGAR